MTVCAPPAAAPRLLKGLAAGADRNDLSRHERVHGALPLPGPRDRRGADHLVGALAAAGLTGRGGAGFPTARKLEAIGRQRRRPVVAVNVCEGEPASHKDRALATGAPHLVLDGAELVARALGAVAVRVCVHRRSPAAAQSLESAIAERRAAGLVSVPTEVRRPPARYISGEESALVHWLDGGDARPTFRLARPGPLRSAGRPTLVENAETLAHIALIGRHGPEWFRSSGSPEAPGTTLVTVSGAVDAPGVLEIPLGLPLDHLLGLATAAPLAGVLLGGYGGTWLGRDRFATPLAPGPLGALGATLGAGVVVALGTDGCGLAETARIAAYLGQESAGQCGPCVFGLPAIADDVAQLAFGRADGAVAERLWSRCAVVAGRGACHHPDGVARLVRSALRTFDEDLGRHLRHGPCDGVSSTVLSFLPSGAVPRWR